MLPVGFDWLQVTHKSQSHIYAIIASHSYNHKVLKWMPSEDYQLKSLRSGSCPLILQNQIRTQVSCNALLLMKTETQTSSMLIKAVTHTVICIFCISKQGISQIKKNKKMSTLFARMEALASELFYPLHLLQSSNCSGVH